MASTANVIYLVTAEIDITSSAVFNGFITAKGTAVSHEESYVTAQLVKKWENVPDDSENWTPAPAASDQWTRIPPAGGSWTQ